MDRFFPRSCVSSEMNQTERAEAEEMRSEEACDDFRVDTRSSSYFRCQVRTVNLFLEPPANVWMTAY